MGSIRKASLTPPTSRQGSRWQGQRGGGKPSGQSLLLTSTLSMCQVRGDHKLPPLSHTHALQARVQAFDHLVGTQSRLLRGPVVMAGRRADSQVSVHPGPRQAQLPSHPWCRPTGQGAGAQQCRDRINPLISPLPCSVAGGSSLPARFPPLSGTSSSPYCLLHPPSACGVKNFSLDGSLGRKEASGVLLGGLPTPGPTHLPSPGPAPDPRGEELGAIQQRAVVVVANKVPKLGRLVAGLRGPGQGLDFHRICRVVEVDDVDVEDQHGRARDLVSWGQNGGRGSAGV